MDKMFFYIPNNQKGFSIDSAFLNKKELTEIIDSDLNFYYVINLVLSSNKENEFLYDDILIDESIINLIIKKKCVVILNASDECSGPTDGFFLIFINYLIKKYNFNYNNFKVLTGDLNVKKKYDYVNCEFIPYCLFEDVPTFINKFSENITLDFFIEINRNKKFFEKKIICYNRISRSQRKYIFYEIFHNNEVFNNSYISLQNNQKYFNYKIEFNIDNKKNKLINDFFINNKTSWSFDDFDKSKNLGSVLDVNIIKKTFLYLVTESIINKDIVFLTEKTFKPIYTCQPFIIFGSPYSLKKLKEMGYKTFDRWWDESYDDEKNNLLRVNKIIGILNFICNKTDDELCIMLNEMEDILIHNHNLFINKKKPSFLKFLDSNQIKKIL